MSNAGQAALGIVGGVIGFFIGGPTGALYGLQIGLAVGTVVSPTQLPGTFGPKLTDNRTTTAQLGGPVVEVFGTDAVAGTVIWLGRVVEHATTEEVGGKGGPEGSQTTYSYNQSIAVGLCRGPMAGVRRIWENGKLVYDIREPAPGEEITDYYNRVVTSQTYALNFTLYLGTEDQMADPTIESEEGVGEVPAYRGLMYIVFANRLLQDDQARRHPNFKFEVYDSGTMTCAETVDYSNDVIYDWGFSTDPRNLCNDHEYRFTTGGGAYRDTLGEAVDDALNAGYPIAGGLIYGWTPTYADERGQIFPYFAPTVNSNPLELFMWFSIGTPRIVDEGIFQPLGIGLGWEQCVWIRDRSPPFWWSGRNSGPVDFEPYVPGVRIFALDLPVYGNIIVNPVAFCEGISERIWHVEDTGISVRRKPTPPMPACSEDACAEGQYTPSDVSGYCFDRDGRLIQAGDWVYDDARAWKALRKYTASDPIKTPLNPILPDDHPNYNNQAFWEAAYNDAIYTEGLGFGLVYGVDYPQVQDHGYYRSYSQCSVVPDSVSIATIVRAICNRCGLTDSDIDVSDLEDRYVNGYQLTRVMDGRSGIAPLRSVGFFDAIESGGLLKFTTRGKPSVRTLDATDLGAHAFGGDAPPIVTTKKMQDVELPRQLFIQHRDPARDYETGEQKSPTRVTTDAVNDVYIDIAAAISADAAIRCAEVLWADMWCARWQHTIALDCSQTDLEPTDCINIPIDGRNERIRLIAVEDSALILRQFQAVRDDDGSYVSMAIAPAVEIPTSGMVIYATTQLVMLDLPPLREADNDAGFYIAAGRAVSGNRWGGASIYRSIDGNTFTSLLSVANEATIGTLFSALPSADAQVWDEGNALVVILPRGSFSSRPTDEVLDGANSLAIGAHGRWEIVQFRDAELIGSNTWQLTGLLRGRRGTDHNIGTSVAGDQAVLISGTGIVRAVLGTAEVNIPVVYRGVTNGTALGTGIDTTFSATGEALRPFSPVHIEATRDDDGNINLDFVRRDRLQLVYVAGEDTAMSEAAEDYEIDVMSALGEVLRTISVSLSQAMYSTDQQLTDFGALQPAIAVRVYQISVAIGRGHYREASV